MTNNEKFNAFINSCDDPRRVLNALRMLASKPRVHQPANVFEEREVSVGELLPLTDVAHLHQNSVGLI